MYGWIIYNGALKFDKIEKLVKSLQKDALALNVTLDLVKNNEIIMGYDRDSTPTMTRLKSFKDPDFIIYWDKDVLLAKRLENMGYRVFNPSNSILLCDNKALMHEHLERASIRVPKTIIAPFVYDEQNLSDDYYHHVVQQLGNEIVIKEAFGSFGMQVYKSHTKETFFQIIKDIKNRPFILQEFIRSSSGRDLRVNIVGDRIIGAMRRESTVDFRANITLGGIGIKTTLTPSEEALALKAHQALNLDFSGVDLLFGENDDPILCEVNSNVNYPSFEVATGLPFGKEIIHHIIGVVYA